MAAVVNIDAVIIAGGGGGCGGTRCRSCWTTSATKVISASGGCCSPGTPINHPVGEVIEIVNDSDYTDEIDQHDETDDAFHGLGIDDRQRLFRGEYVKAAGRPCLPEAFILPLYRRRWPTGMSDATILAAGGSR